MNNITIYNRQTEDVVEYQSDVPISFAIGEEIRYIDSKNNKVWAYVRKVTKDLMIEDAHIISVLIKIEVF